MRGEVMPPSGTVTFLFTDIEGSTPLWDANPGAMRRALVDHDEIVRGAIEASNGHVFSTGGDGFGAVFARAADAVTAGAVAQSGLIALDWPEGVVLRVRMGVHTGEVQERDGDYFGAPVNRAARLMGAAHGGQLVLSALTAELVDHVEEIKLIDLGDVALKGVIEPVHVFGVSAEGLEWLDRQLVSDQPIEGNLPRPQTEMVGNLANLQERVSLLPQAGLVTLTGSGGVGKTRAAIEIGWLVVDEFLDGVWVAELAPIADPDGVVPAVASMLGVQAQPQMTVIEAIIDWCLGRRMLLIIDNCEHVLDPVLELVTALVPACPTVTVLATSREPLGAAGEQVIRVPSLEAEPSIELFLNRASAADSMFVPSADDLAAINAICSRLDGIPLAIELAAARTRSLSPVELLDRLDDRFRLLRGGGRGGLERHQTLRAAVTWSYQLLSDTDKVLFDRASVFAGTFDLAAAETVCAGGEVDEFDVVDLISELVDKSMLIAERGDGVMRYRQLETLRQYGEERLDDRGETAAMRDRHLDYYLQLADKTRDSWFGVNQSEADATFAREWDNLRAAHNWAITTEDLDLSETLLMATGWHANEMIVHEHQEWANRTLKLSRQCERHSPVALGACAGWAFVAGDIGGIIQFASEGAAGDPDDQFINGCRSLLMIGLLSNGQIAEAAELAPLLRGELVGDLSPDVTLIARIALSIAPVDEFFADDCAELAAYGATIGSPQILGRVAMSRAMALFANDEPDFAAALRHLIDVIRLGTVGSPTVLMAHCSVAMCSAVTDRADGVSRARDALALAYDVRFWFGVDQALGAAARSLCASNPEAAATILGWIAPKPPGWVGTVVRMRTETLEAVARMPQGDEWMANGASLGRHEMVAYALEQLADPVQVEESPGGS